MMNTTEQQEQQIIVIKQAFSTALRDLFEKNDPRKYMSVVQKFHQLNLQQLILTFKALSRIASEIVHARPSSSVSSSSFQNSTSTTTVNFQFSDCKDLVHAILSTSTKVLCSNNKELQNSFDTLCLALYTTSASSSSTINNSVPLLVSNNNAFEKKSRPPSHDPTQFKKAHDVKVSGSIHGMIMSCIVEHFHPIPDFELQRIEENSGGIKLTRELIETMERTRKQNVHNLLYKLQKKATNQLLFIDQLKDKIRHNYPHASYSLSIHRAFVGNLLSLDKYIPSLTSFCFTLVVQSLIEMDAQLVAMNAQTDGSMSASSGNKNSEGVDLKHLENAIFDFEFDESNAEEMRIYCAEKLDSIVTVLFEYINERANAPPTSPIQLQPRQHNKYLESGNSECKGKNEFMDSIFHSMMILFRSFVLNQYQLHSIQFLMFYICSFHVNYMERFISFLLGNIFNSQIHNEVRKCCAAYLSGMLSRAKYVSNTVILKTLGQLLNWCDKYITTFEQSVQYLDVETHSLFYSICQGVFYILCFKIHQLIKPETAEGEDNSLLRKDVKQLMAESRQFFSQSPIKKIMYSKFNPLKIVAQDVAEEVVDAFSRYYLFDFHHVLEENQNIVIPLRGGYGGVNYLENNFFPFDPYLLRQSEKFILPHYQKWEGGNYSGVDFSEFGNFNSQNSISSSSQNRQQDYYGGSSSSVGHSNNMMDEWDRLRNMNHNSNHRNSEANNFLFESLHSPHSKSPLASMKQVKRRLADSFEDDMMDDDDEEPSSQGIFELSEDEQDEYQNDGDSSIDSGDEEPFEADDDEMYYEAGNTGIMIHGQHSGRRSPPRTISIDRKRSESGASNNSLSRRNGSLLGMSFGSGSLEDSPVKSPYGWNAISLSPNYK
ncbi:hypothetical protein C9374_004912 [Naegleria lovaniensis]|uniref:Uncharacterized protein n=1 Tax=Naegleria lovaniensis TaxID=51637 RepID=A0AA88GMC1_NAELO|nr:uncharacterized protein C9374_004912 [Naegleria lovaniensis]KAG2382945.1 hypothetical protein C9374_004912 [Naegleria lovaniensis]